MGRKFKVSFSNTDEDTALSYMHDLGFIPKVKDGKRGFKILIGGGLGAQPRLADVAYEFLPTEEIVPFMEAVLRVFDRHGERNSRSKARMKFLLAKIGLEETMRLVEEEKLTLKNKVYPIEGATDAEVMPTQISEQTIADTDKKHYDDWFNTNVISQKQAGYHGVYVRVPLGNIGSETSRQLADKLEGYVGDDVRVTINQSLFLRNVPTANLPHVFNALNAHYLAEAGANSLHKITACPGTDTCNLAISDSTHVTVALESVLRDEFPELVNDSDIKIKISGCMNSCGQHGMAQIGFHGSSMRAKDRRVMPALQVLLGGGTIGDGEGRIADKVIKIPSKQGPEVLRYVLSDYEQNRTEGEYFNDYYDRREGKIYFYDLLKPLADIVDAPENFFVDWGQDGQFATEIGVGECAGVIIDLIGTLFLESDEKVEFAKEAFAAEKWADAIYHAYSSQVNTAKALLLDRDVKCNTQHKVIADMDDVYAKEFGGNVQEQILAIRKNEPSKDFATDYIATAVEFLRKSREVRGSEVVL
jgi:sulfite reductase (ferredoxin)